LCATDRIDHGANGAFAIRSGDVNDFPWSSFQDVTLRKFFEQALDVFQTELDSETLEAVKPTERLTIIDRRVSRHANAYGLARPSRSAPAGPIHGAIVK
jgi:hypothetical protein